jgi:tetratricopeptide (TPR) repeat protein
VASAAYHNSFRVPELLDDPSAISGNPSIRQLWPPWHALNPPADSGTGGRPIANLTFAANYASSKLDLVSYHGVNLAIHISAALVFFEIVRRTFARLSGARSEKRGTALTSATTIGLANALLWALHPVQTIAVTYLSQRTESLMGLCYLTTLYAFIRGTDPGAKAIWHWFSVVACFAGMACKEVMVTAPLSVLLYDRTFLARSFRNAFQTRRTYYFILFSAWILLALLMRGVGARQVGFDAGVEWWRYALTECRAIVTYLRLGMWPHPLIFDYGRDYIDGYSALPYVVVTGLMIAAALWALRSRRSPGFLVAWFFLLLAPSSSIVPVAQQPIAENRLYLPLGGASVLAASIAYRLFGSRAFLPLTLSATSFLLLSERRNQDYESATRIWADTIMKRPENARGFDNYGQSLHRASRPVDAIEQYKHALSLNELSDATHGLIGDAYLAAGNPRDAIRHYERAIELRPKSEMYHNNLAAAFTQAGDSASALAEYGEALRLAPDFAVAHVNLGKLLHDLGRYAEAAHHLQQALELGYQSSHLRATLGTSLLQSNLNEEAASNLKVAVEEQPKDSDVRNNYGVALLRLRRFEDAAAQFKAALVINPRNSSARTNLEYVYSTQAPLTK